jgi:hypothetical protein
MKHLFKSLSEFQQECPIIIKSSQGYGYQFADLPAIFTIINPLLKKHGLGFTQVIVSNQIQTIVFHVDSGESITSHVDIPQGVVLKGMNEFQVLGSAITYLRRYALSAMLGLVTDKDTDGAGLQADSPKVSTKQASAPVEDDKPWLNESSPSWSAVLESMKNGYTITDVRKKFKVSKAIETKLASSLQ